MLRYDMRSGVKKIKTKTFLAFSGATLGIMGLVMAVGIPLGAKAATQVVVTPSNPHGWIKIAEANGGTINYVASSGALGTGAAEFTTPTNDSYTRFRKDVSMKLSDATNLSYMTKQISGNPSTAAVNLRLYIHTNGANTCGPNFDDVLVYEPYYNSAVTSPNWQTWNINQSTGFWWSNCQVTYNGHTPVQAGSYATNFNLSDVTHDFTDATIVSIGLGTGDSNSPWKVQADALTVNDTTYNFEPSQLAADGCKKDGWKTMNDGIKTFKNQGDCVSFFVTNGSNKAAGQNVEQ